MTITVTPKFAGAADLGFGGPFTLTGVTLGAGDYILMTSNVSAQFGTDPSTVTVDGVSASRVGTSSLDRQSQGQQGQNQFWKVQGITSSTGNVVVNGIFSGIGVIGWLVSGADFSTISVGWQPQSAVADPQEVTVTVPSGGVVLAGMGFANFTTLATPPTWVGVSRDTALEAEEVVGNGESIFGAHSTSASGSTTIDFTSTGGASNFSGGLVGALTMSASGGAAAPTAGWQRNEEFNPPRNSTQFQGPPAFGRAIPAPSNTISGMAWHEVQDRQRPATRITQESPASFVTVLPASITWSFDSGDTIFLRDSPVDSPPAFGRAITAPINTISGMSWFEPLDRDRPRLKVIIEASPALALTPPPLAVQVSGIAWFEPPDRDRRPTKVNGEASPALALTPSTLPVPIRGMAWQELPPRAVIGLTVNYTAPPAWEPRFIAPPAPPPPGTSFRGSMSMRIGLGLS